MKRGVSEALHSIIIIDKLERAGGFRNNIPARVAVGGPAGAEMTVGAATVKGYISTKWEMNE